MFNEAVSANARRAIAREESAMNLYSGKLLKQVGQVSARPYLLRSDGICCNQPADLVHWFQ
jgi:hypothetical protein